MRREVAVPEVEPALGAQCGHRLEAVERLVDAAPAARDVERAAEGVGDGVEIRRDVEAPDLGVVARVADDGQLRWIEDPREAAQELRGAGAAGERGDAQRSGGVTRR